MKIIYLIIILTYLHAQMPFDCVFGKTNLLNRSELQSNAIIDFRKGLEDTLYIGTGNGLGKAVVSNPLSPIFSIIDECGVSNGDNSSCDEPLLPEGGIPALKTYTLDDDGKMIILSGAMSTYEEADDDCHARGTGISWSEDSGLSWQYIGQPVDDGEPGKFINFPWYGQQLSKKVWHTTVDNVSYDVAVDINRKFIYSTSWGGGLRRFNYIESSTQKDTLWEVIPLPMDNQDSLFCDTTYYSSHYINYEYNPVDPPDGSDNHKAFSVHTQLDTVWVGTAGGVNKGVVQENGCINWKHYNTDDGLGGNWVIGVIPQDYNTYTRLWLISWISPDSPHPLTYTDDGGKTWHVVTQLLDMGIIVYNLSFSSKHVIASTDHGLYISDYNDGSIWHHLPITNDLNGERILTDKYFTAISIVEDEFDTLLIGTEDGLSIISMGGETIDNIRFWETPISFSAYPNPFFINEYNQVGNDRYVRFIYSNPNQNSGNIDVFDFAMDQVIHLDNANPVTQDENEIIWNGRNQYGDKVANGVYFCRLSLKGKYYWTKLAVIN